MRVNLKIPLIYISIVLISFILISTAKNIKNNLEVKKAQIKFLEKNLSNKKSQLANIHSKLLKKEINIENLLFEDGINFVNNSNKEFSIGSQNYLLKEFNSSDIIFAKHPAASSSAYIDYYNENIFLVTATGQIAYTNIQNFEKKKLQVKSS